MPGVDIAGLIIDAGSVNSPVLLQHRYPARPGGAAREHNGWSDPADPTGLQDVFFRVGGPHLGKANVSLEVNSDNVVLDDIWAWRADHGSGVGWTQNTADTGLIVNGDDVTATGLFVEHYQKFQVIWNGANGTDVFFQSEMPYDVPSQAAWMSSPSTLGYAAVKVTRAPASPVTAWARTASSTRAWTSSPRTPTRCPLRRPPARPADHLPRCQQRQGRHPQRRQRHRRPLDHRQPGRPGHRRQLPVECPNHLAPLMPTSLDLLAESHRISQTIVALSRQ